MALTTKLATACPIVATVLQSIALGPSYCVEITSTKELRREFSQRFVWGGEATTRKRILMHPDETHEVKAKHRRLYTTVDNFTLEHNGAVGTALPPSA